VIFHPGKIIFEDFEATEDRACILHLDPVTGYYDRIEEDIRDFLCESRMSEHPRMNETLAKMLFSRVKYVQVEVPQQKNDCDSGIYVLHFAEKYIKAPSQFHMISKNWFSEHEILSKRSYIHDLIFTLDNKTKQRTA
jgi:Ulp1 family protease